MKESLLYQKTEEDGCQAICSSVIYGANGAGKTSLLTAIQLMQDIVKQGGIQAGRNDRIHLCPSLRAPDNPVLLEIVFVYREQKVTYKIAFVAESLLDPSHERKIVEEELQLNDRLIFRRTENNVEFGRTGQLKNWMDPESLRELNFLKTLAQSSLQPQQLFLTHAFAHTMSASLADLVTSWFEKELLIYASEDALPLFQLPTNSVPVCEGQTQILHDPTLTEAARKMGAICDGIALRLDEQNRPVELLSFFNKDGQTVFCPVQHVESKGICKILYGVPMVSYALASGATLMLDEMDFPVHPKTLREIITLFHNPEVNRHQAQLILTTNMPLYLNGTIFRRDEIKFIDWDEEAQSSVLYTLADFGTYNGTGVRKGATYYKDYLTGKFGAVPRNDLSDLVWKMTEMFSADQKNAS